MAQLLIAILEDDCRRIARMAECLRQRLPRCEVVLFDGAPEMTAWLGDHLAEVALICLDHDLGANRLADGDLRDPGTGRDVADFLALQPPSCPVLIHTSNPLAAPGMMMALEDAGWKCSRLSPYCDLEWVDQSWIEEVEEALGMR